MTRRPSPRLPAEVVRLRGALAHVSKAEKAQREAEEVRARPMHPTPPPWLSLYGRQCWDELAPELEHLGLFTVLDGPAFALACECHGLARASLDELRPKKADGTPDRRSRRPMMIEADPAHGGMTRRHPALLSFFAAAREFRAFNIEFGLTPSARARLRAGTFGLTPPGKPADGDSDDDEAFFGS